MSIAQESLQKAIGPGDARALAQHEIVDLARAGIILFVTILAALFVPRSLFATTPETSSPAAVHAAAPASK